MDCQTVRTEVHIEPATVQPHLGTCPTCAAYAARFARLDRLVRGELVVQAPTPVTQRIEALIPAPSSTDWLDVAVRDHLLVTAPSALTSRLLDLVPQPAKVTSRLDVALKAELVVQAPPELTTRLQALIAHMFAAPASQAVSAPARPRRWVVMTVYAVTMLLVGLSLMYAGQVYTTVITQLGLEQWLQQVAGLPAQFLEWLYATLPQSRIAVGVIVRLQQPLQWLLVALFLWAVIDMTQRRPQRAQQYA